MNSVNTKKEKRLFFEILLVVAFVALFGRFFYLQIIRSEHYLGASEKNRIREMVVQPPRGLIFDRKGEILVDNDPAYSVYGIPYDLKNADTTYSRLSQILNTPVNDLKTIIKTQANGLFQPVKMKRNIPFDMLAQLEEQKLQMPGIEFEVEPQRTYPSGVKAPHVFGYLGEISPAELSFRVTQNYATGDIVGKKGLERVYEDDLRGKKGISFTEVDAFGRRIRSLNDGRVVNSEPGKNLFLTIDADLQRWAEAELEGAAGGIVVLQVKTGDVLVISSKPDFEPEFFARPRTLEQWSQLASDPNHPLYDRVLQGAFPAGSVFKIVLAAAALEAGVVDLSQMVTCPGFKRVGNKIFDCWKVGGHGSVNFLDAIEQSCNVYFYNLMSRVPLKRWYETGRDFGFGQVTGIDLNHESSGLLPDKDYLDQKYGVKGWGEGQLCNLAIGQGDVLVTPLQMAVFAMIIANEGTYYQPHIVKSIQDAATGVVTEKSNPVHKVTGISPATFQILKEGMYRVANGAAGTARSLAYSGVIAAGKTGTAENPHGKAHAWFIGFAPALNPEIAFCIFLENQGSGGAVAVPIARLLLERYFQPGGKKSS
jgi:penicillin-binding protein 2